MARSAEGVPSPASFEGWLAWLAQSGSLTGKGRAVVSVLRSQPRLSAFASSTEIAARADVNIGTVTRAAQSLGYTGWSELQHEFRSRYMASLSASEVASEHLADESSAAASISRDRSDLAFLARSVPGESIQNVARKIAQSRQTIVLAQGSYAGVGLVLAHNAQIAGHDVNHISDPAVLANAVARMRPNDLLIAINCWQIYASTLEGLRAAAELGAASVLITDFNSPLLESLADTHIDVPSESVAFFPSLVAVMSVCQAIIVELAQLDPQRTREAIVRAEAEWDRHSLLRRNAR